MVICLERGADLHMAQLMPLPLTVSCFSKIQIGFAFLVPAHLGSPGKGPLNVCVCSLGNIIKQPSAVWSTIPLTSYIMQLSLMPANHIKHMFVCSHFCLEVL